ncbi:MAG: hypothetical protein JSU83_05060 [Deltaproteobacteria bacterium]|nr:MAG: hypothetical protein JSU83_05060 [Deltaproteobacteria bacterium]
MKPVTPSGKWQGSCRRWIEQAITRHLVVAKIAPILQCQVEKIKVKALVLLARRGYYNLMRAGSSSFLLIRILI